MHPVLSVCPVTGIDGGLRHLSCDRSGQIKGLNWSALRALGQFSNAVETQFKTFLNPRRFCLWLGFPFAQRFIQRLNGRIGVSGDRHINVTVATDLFGLDIDLNEFGFPVEFRSQSVTHALGQAHPYNDYHIRRCS